MPMIIDYIDKIARDKKRAVLYVDFFRDLAFEYDYKNCKTRQALIAWMDDNDIAHRPCGYIGRENGWESYRGQLYIDVAMDNNNPKYLLLNEHLENEDGSMKDKNIMYYYVALEVAMKNVHHDEIGFWDDL